MGSTESLITAIGTVADTPAVQEVLTPPGELTCGAYAAGAASIVLDFASGGANAADIGEIGAGILTNLLTDLVGSVFSAAADAVPIVGQVFGFVLDWMKSDTARREQEEAQRIAQQRAECKAERLKWKPIGSGAWGNVYPADYFIQATRDPAGLWTIHRQPYLGRFLKTVVGTRWPRWFVETASNVQMSRNELIRAMGGNALTDAERAALTGPDRIWRRDLDRNLYDALHESEATSQGPTPDTHNWPPETPESRLLLELFEGVAGQHPAILQRDGRSLGEAGREAWPLVCDLIYSLCRIPRPPWWNPLSPWDEATAAAWGLVPVPPLNEVVVRGLYQTRNVDDDSGSYPFVAWDNLARVQPTGLAERANPLGICHGTGVDGCNLLYGIADGWRLYALPATKSDAEQRTQQLAEAWAWIWSELRGRSITAAASKGSMLRPGAKSVVETIARPLGWSPQTIAAARQVLDSEPEKVSAARIGKVATAAAIGLGTAGLAAVLLRG